MPNSLGTYSENNLLVRTLLSRTMVAIPPLPGREVQTLPGRKVKEESRGSLRGVPADPPTKKSQKQVSWRLCESKLTCFLGSQHPSPNVKNL